MHTPDEIQRCCPKELAAVLSMDRPLSVMASEFEASVTESATGLGRHVDFQAEAF